VTGPDQAPNKLVPWGKKDVRDVAMDIIDVALRLIVAAMIGVAFGLNRDLHGKPTGVRTLGLIALGAATVVLGVGRGVGADTSRVVQGIVTGIGFIGAGVIVRSDQPEVVHGLTTAACVWLTACGGAVCGVADWSVILLGAPLVVLVLTFGGSLEQTLHRHWPPRSTTDA
jgi:putative Mg2+ transporter-C (MgtC) family protein